MGTRPTKPETDDAIIGRAVAGDERAFAELRDRYAGLVVRIASHSLRLCRSDLDDVTQAVWIKVWRNLGRYDRGRPFKKWVVAVAANTARDHARVKLRRNEVELGDFDPTSVRDAHTDEPATVEIPDKLSAKQVDVGLLAARGVPYAGIAAALGIPIGSVKSALHRFRELAQVA